MKIATVESYALAAPNPAARAYWGKAAWGEDAPGAARRGAAWELLRYPAPERMKPVYSATIDTTVVRIVTDTGMIGWGEAKAPVAPGVSKAIIDALFRDALIGRDPFDVEVIWETLYASMRLRGHSTGFLLEAMSGIDIALWDLIGKATGQPIHKLMGGAYRDRVKVYASGVPGSRAAPGEPDWERMLEAVREIKSGGFLGLKMGLGLGLEADIRAVKAVREEAGSEMALFADAAGNYAVDSAIRLGQALLREGVGFLEAPLPHEFYDGYARVAQALPLPIASDVLANRYQVLEYLKRGGLAIVQPDVCRAGGLTELKRIAVIADAFGAAFTPHVSIGSAIHVAASLHSAAAAPNLVQMEYWFGQNPLSDAVLKVPALAVVDGHVNVPSGPGLGIEIDEDKLLSYASAA